MKFKQGDLIAERLSNAFYLILLTKVFGNRGHGYVLDSYDYDYKSRGYGEPDHTADNDRENTFPIRFEDCILVEEK